MGNSFGYNDRIGTVLQFAGFVVTLILLIFVEIVEKKKKEARNGRLTDFTVASRTSKSDSRVES